MEGDFKRYGFWVPLIAVSPYVKRAHITRRMTDNASVLRFVEARFNLPAITRRDANAEPPYDMFDFERPDFSTPTLKEAVVDQTLRIPARRSSADRCPETTPRTASAAASDPSQRIGRATGCERRAIA